MAEDKKSAEVVAKRLGVPRTMIDNLRSGAQTDISLANFVKLTHIYGYDVILEKAGERITLQTAG